MNAEELAKALHNIGPVMAEKLVNAGIDTPEKIKKLGPKKVFLQTIKHDKTAFEYNANYLYALWGAINNCDYRLVPEDIKEDFKKFTEKLRNKPL